MSLFPLQRLVPAITNWWPVVVWSHLKAATSAMVYPPMKSTSDT